MDINVKHLSSLAGVVYNAWFFANQDYNARTKFYCTTRAKEVTANDLFVRPNRQYYFVRPAALPAHQDIKCVGLNQSQQRLYIETTAVDFKKAANQLAQARASFDGLEIKGRRFFWQGEHVVSSQTRRIFNKPAGMRGRTCFHTHQTVKVTPVKPLVLIAQLIYDFNCFIEEEQPQLPSAQAKLATAEPAQIRRELVQKMTQEQRMSLQQLLSREQRPVMIMTMRQNGRLFDRQEVLQMSTEQLRRHITTEVQKNPALESSDD